MRELEEAPGCSARCRRIRVRGTWLHDCPSPAFSWLFPSRVTWLVTWHIKIPNDTPKHYNKRLKEFFLHGVSPRNRQERILTRTATLKSLAIIFSSVATCIIRDIPTERHKQHSAAWDWEILWYQKNKQKVHLRFVFLRAYGRARLTQNPRSRLWPNHHRPPKRIKCQTKTRAFWQINRF